MTETRTSSLLDRFPALRRLDQHRRRRVIPHVQQLATADCGAACLTMVLGFFGRHEELAEVRSVVGYGRDGTTVRALKHACQFFGLRGRGVRVELEQIDQIPQAAILHWNFSHFVVFDGLRGKKIAIVDPALGRRLLDLAEFRKSFTGVALFFETGEGFQKKKRGRVTWMGPLANLRLRGVFGRIMAMSMVLQALNLALPVLTGVIVDLVIPRNDRQLMALLVAAVALVLLFNLCAQLVRGYLLVIWRTQIDAEMTVGFVEHLLSLPFKFFQQRTSGDLLMRLNSNAAVRNILTGSMVSAVIDGTLVVLYWVILLIARPVLAALTILLTVGLVVLLIATRDRRRELTNRYLETRAKDESYQVEMLSGIETLKAMGVEATAGEHWSNLYVDTLNVVLERDRLDIFVHAVQEVMRRAGPLVVISYGAYLVLGGGATIGEMLVLSTVATIFLDRVGTLLGEAERLQMLRSYGERLADVFDTKSEKSEGGERRIGVLKGAITAERLSYRHGPLDPFVVADVSFDIAAGQTLALVGSSGSGKSTLARLLIGLYRPTSGSIRYDNQNLAEIDVGDLRRQIGVVSQDSHLFGASIRGNITMAAPHCPLERVIEVAKIACIHDDIMAMPLGYDTPLADQGFSLSGGQRQRLALARALINHPKVLLLDEATSALDAATEEMVRTNLERLDCTKILVAHRLHTIRNADTILVMRDGAVIESGRHEQLVLLGGTYAKLTSAQLSAT